MDYIDDDMKDNSSYAAITYKGSFCASQCLALAMLSEAVPLLFIDRCELSKIPQYRSTDKIFIDIGGQYDPKQNRYDAVSGTNVPTRRDGTAFSAASLIWKHYGSTLLKNHHLPLSIWSKMDAKCVSIDVGCVSPFKDLTGLTQIIRSYNSVDSRKAYGDRFYDAVELCQKWMWIQLRNFTVMEKK